MSKHVRDEEERGKDGFFSRLLANQDLDALLLGLAGAAAVAGLVMALSGGLPKLAVQTKPSGQTARSATGGETAAAQPRIAQAASARATASPMEIKAGKRLFEENCVACHQADAIGLPGTAPSLTNPELLSIASDTFLMGTIRDGREGTGMPPFAHLGREGITQIVSYLRSHASVADRSKEVELQPDAHGDPRLGQQWYDNVCSTCHGVAGDGYQAGGAGTAIALPGFLDKASDGFIRVTVKEGRSGTRMLPFSGPKALANLSDSEIDDIIVYLRGLHGNR